VKKPQQKKEASTNKDEGKEGIKKNDQPRFTSDGSHPKIYHQSGHCIFFELQPHVFTDEGQDHRRQNYEGRFNGIPGRNFKDGQDLH